MDVAAAGGAAGSSGALSAAVSAGRLVDAAALAAAGKVVDEALLRVAFGCLPGLRSLKVQGAGALTCHGLCAAAAAASPHLELLVVAGCPRVRQVAAEQLASDLGRPWLRVHWLP
jgi:hypothetical protein